MTGNRKSFSLIIKERKSFNVILSYFDFAITFLFSIKQKISLSYVMSTLSKISQSFYIKKIRISILSFKLFIRIFQLINIKRIKLSIVLRQIMRFVIVPKLQIDLSAYSILRQKILSSIILKRIKLNLTAVLATFYPLSTYDPQSLLTLDSKTLGEMDYTAI